jgi:broad specificity phosphatase PhoE
MTRLHLVRHGRPRPDDRRAAEWPLDPSDEGVTKLRRSGVLPERGRWFSSPEPKAFATARALTDGALGLVDGLREMTRPARAWLDTAEWAALVRRSMTEPDTPAAPGWESARATTERVVGVVARIRESCPGEEIVLVGHGTAWTLLVAALTGRPPDLEAWERLRLPDHCLLEVGDETARVLAPWGSWADRA